MMQTVAIAWTNFKITKTIDKLNASITKDLIVVMIKSEREPDGC